MAADGLDTRADLDLLRRWRLATGPGECADVYDALRAAGPLVPTSWGPLLAVGYEDCKQVLSTPVWRMLGANWRDGNQPEWRKSPVAVAASRTVLQLDPPEHAGNRRRLTAALSPRAATFVPAAADRLLGRGLRDLAERVRHEGIGDLVTAVCRPTPMALLTELLGLPAADHERLDSLARACVLTEEIVRPPSLVRQGEAAVGAMLDYIDRALSQRLRKPAGDILSHWAATDPAGGRYLALMLLTAGSITTSTLLASVALALLTLPESERSRYQDPSRAERLVDEVLRWDPPARVPTRVACSATVLGDVRVPAGQVVYAVIGAAHRDPHVFERPHVFDPGRAPQRLLAFGSGPHYCPGATMARAQAVAFVRHFTEVLPTARLAGPVRRRTGPVFTDITHLPVALPPGPRRTESP
ncbi:cytochrome P450 [Streptomyces abikoensis]|uniref:Cytochrome P450 n=1 Tax=Streptomyces abikoensis TaxID=97398 RepID=A0ABW7TCP0_9ACTN